MKGLYICTDAETDVVFYEIINSPSADNISTLILLDFDNNKYYVCHDYLLSTIDNSLNNVKVKDKLFINTSTNNYEMDNAKKHHIKITDELFKKIYNLKVDKIFKTKKVDFLKRFSLEEHLI
jgi:hypothetical protein